MSNSLSRDQVADGHVALGVVSRGIDPCLNDRTRRPGIHGAVRKIGLKREVLRRPAAGS
jgi:hypothetical protein